MFDLYPYSTSNLFHALSNSFCAPAQISRIIQAQYLASYLSQLGAKTILVECTYIDGDYLDDFASYYVRCWKPYDRFCKRLHFFSESYTAEIIREFVAGGVHDTTPLSNSYLGFVVARPLPQAVIGKTVLKPYESNGRRYYPCTREYNANLFGIPLTVQSLPYQQQDTVLAACATVSLWSCLHMTGGLFATSCPRPATITRMANQVVGDFRPLPSRGLRIEQMCHALRCFDLEPEVVRISKALPLISLMYAYIHMGIPVLLLLEAGGLGHAVAVNGYRLESAQIRTEEVSGGCLPMRGLNVEKFYAHDDAMGPFARLWIKGPGTRPSDKVEVPVVFESNHKDANGAPLQLYPTAVILPVYNKIRLTFLELQMWLECLHFVVKSVWQDMHDLQWDIHLSTVNDFKADIRRSTFRDIASKERILLRAHPRFIWKSTLHSIAKGEVLEILADATDLKDSIPFYHMEIFDSERKATLTTNLQAPNIEKVLKQSITEQFYNCLKNWCTDPSGSISCSLQSSTLK